MMNSRLFPLLFAHFLLIAMMMLASSCFKGGGRQRDTRPSTANEPSPGYDVVTRYSAPIDPTTNNVFAVDSLTFNVPNGALDVEESYVISIESWTGDRDGSRSESLGYDVTIRESDGELATLNAAIDFTLAAHQTEYEQEQVIVVTGLGDTGLVGEVAKTFFFQAGPVEDDQSFVLLPQFYGDTFAHRITTQDAAPLGYSSTVECAGLVGGSDTSWVSVPPYFDQPRSAWTEPGFCIMKFEMKDGGTDLPPISQPAGLPIVNISRDDAHVKCQAFGEGYTLITNTMWQSAARQIETAQSPSGIYLNWKEGVYTSTTDQMNRGHSDIGPNAHLAASDKDSEGCFGVTANGDPADDCGGVWHINKRTHTLPNGGIIWDMAANVAEWVLDETGEGERMAHINAADIRAAEGYDLVKWGPEGDHSDKTSDSNRAGLGVAYLDNPAGAVTRGGNVGGATATGLFNSIPGKSPTTPLTFVGFRCVYRGVP